MGMSFSRNTLFSSHALAQPRELAFLGHKALLLLLDFIVARFRS
jgi:hypothetical protein